MALNQSSLVGSWKKATGSNCAEPYPAGLEFLADGTYRARNESSGDFSIWDVGTFSVTPDGLARLSTANDAVVAYGVTLSDNLLTFVAPDDCQIAYRRLG